MPRLDRARHIVPTLLTSRVVLCGVVLFFGSTSPLKQLKAFPQELVLMGRATVMIKGIAAALGLKWNLAARVRGTANDK